MIKKTFIYLFVLLICPIKSHAMTERIFQMGDGTKISNIGLSPNGSMLAVGTRNNGLYIISLGTKKTSTQIEIPTSALAFNPNNSNELICGSTDGIVRLVNLQDMAHPIELYRHDGHIYSIAFSPNGEFLASTDYDTLKIYSINQRSILHALTSTHDYNPLVFSHDSKKLAWHSQTLNEFSILNLEIKHIHSFQSPYPGTDQQGCAMLFSDDSKTISFKMAGDSCLRSINLEDKNSKIQEQAIDLNWVQAIAINPTIGFLAMDVAIRVGEIGKDIYPIAVIDIKDKKVLYFIENIYDKPVKFIDISQDGTKIAIVYHNGEIRVLPHTPNIKPE